MSKRLIHGLQVFRGLAALAVVAHHAALSTNDFVQRLPLAWMKLFDLGALGVDFFFVLSGFIIMHAHSHEAQDVRAVIGYVYKRIARIFPAYWPVGLTVMGLYLALPSMSASGGRQFSYLSSTLLLPTELPPALPVAWTLVHELMFYGVFMLWFISRRVFWSALLLWTATVVAIAFAAAVPAGPLRYPLSMLNMEFMLGAVSATIYGRLSPLFPPITFTVPGCLLSAVAAFAIYEDVVPASMRLALALGLAALMLGIALQERQQPIAWPALMLMLGNASYSLYLVHNPLLSLTQRLAGRFFMNWPLAMLLGIGCSLACGYAYYLWVERLAVQFFSRPRAPSWRALLPLHKRRK